MTATDSFNIDDAFQSDDEDKVRLYGSTKATSVVAVPKTRPTDESHQDEVEVLDRKGGITPTSHLLPSQSTRSLTSVHSGDTHVSTRSYSESTSWLRHPKVRENWRVVLGAFALTIIGSALFLTGVGIMISPQRGIHSLVFFVGGLLCLIPGAYHLVYIYLAAKGFNGYSLYNLPVFR